MELKPRPKTLPPCFQSLEPGDRFAAFFGEVSMYVTALTYPRWNMRDGCWEVTIEDDFDDTNTLAVHYPKSNPARWIVG